MSLLGALRERIGSDGGEDSVPQRARRRVRRAATDVDGQRVRRAAGQTTRRLDAVDIEGTPRRRRRPADERELAKRAEETASMAGPIDATLDPASTTGIDQLAEAGNGDEATDREPTADDLATDFGGYDGGILARREDGDDGSGGWF